MSHAFGTLEELGEGYGFRKIGRASCRERVLDHV